MPMKTSDFATFILTHGRPDRVYTVNTLKRSGYTGPIYLIVDDEDKTLEEYRKRYSGQVLTFSKKEIAKTFDEGDNFSGHRGVIYARNACHDLAKSIGIKYFFELDDDYTDFRYKFNDKQQYGDWVIKDLDAVLDHLLDYYKSIPAVSIALAQGGDFIGGKEGTMAKKIKPTRKVMNTFICSTDRPFKFIGRINEDVNTYTLMSLQGHLFFTIPLLAIQQKMTQSNANGMTDLYLDYGTYVKSFYSVLYCPSSVKITEMGSEHRRIHHKVTWNNTAPVIVDEKYRKIKSR
jgi:hypothetical protein